MKLRTTCFTLMMAALLTGMVAAQGQRNPRDIIIEQNTRRWAILVGVNDYVHIGNLKYCVNDVTTLRDEMLKHGYEDKRMFCLTTRSEAGPSFQPTRANIGRVISQVFRQMQKGDQILIVLSGHGLMINGKSFYCPEDADPKQPETTLINIEQLYEQLDQSNATNKMLVVDACRNRPSDSVEEVPDEIVESMSRNPLEGFKAADGTKGIEKLPPPPQGIALLSSCNEGEFSFEDSQLGHGVFTHFLIEGIRGDADMNGDGLISLLELTNYVCEETPLYTMKKFSAAQTPYLTGKTTAYYIATADAKPGPTGNQPVATSDDTDPPEQPSGQSRGIAKNYTLNLANVALGTLPQGWDGPDNAVVNNVGGRKCLTNSSERNSAELTLIDLFNQPGDFVLNFTIHARIQTNTSGQILDENGNAISFLISNYSLTDVRFGDATAARIPNRVINGFISNTYTISRRGNVLSMTCEGLDGDTIIQRSDTFKSLVGFTITLPNNNVGISQFNVRSLDGSEAANGSGTRNTNANQGTSSAQDRSSPPNQGTRPGTPPASIRPQQNTTPIRPAPTRPIPGAPR